MMWRDRDVADWQEPVHSFLSGFLEVLTIAFGQLAFGAASLCANGKCAMFETDFGNFDRDIT